MKDLDIELGGVTLRLCPERAAFRPAEGELLVADVHIGKAAAFRRAGRAMPPGTTRRELERIDALVARLGARRLTLLGDLFHDEVEPDSPTARTFSRWLLERSDLEVTLVRGNHDRHAVVDHRHLDAVDRLLLIPRVAVAGKDLALGEVGGLGDDRQPVPPGKGEHPAQRHRSKECARGNDSRQDAAEVEGDSRASCSGMRGEEFRQVQGKPAEKDCADATEGENGGGKTTFERMHP